MVLKKVAALAVLGLLQSCAPGNFELTKCGQHILVETMAEDQTMEDIQQIEDEFVEFAGMYAAPKDSRFANTCEPLNGWTIEFVNELYKFDANGNKVYLAGQTWTAYGWVYIKKRESIRVSSLTHEWAHIVQNGVPTCKDTDDSDHACWDRDGITIAVECVRRPDTCPINNQIK